VARRPPPVNLPIPVMIYCAVTVFVMMWLLL
jgi:hypothetical protein